MRKLVPAFKSAMLIGALLSTPMLPKSQVPATLFSSLAVSAQVSDAGSISVLAALEPESRKFLEEAEKTLRG